VQPLPKCSFDYVLIPAGSFLLIVVGRTSASGWVSAPFVLNPSDGVVFGRFDLAALRGCQTFNSCLFVYLSSWICLTLK
jgi:hypothetical protein